MDAISTAGVNSTIGVISVLSIRSTVGVFLTSSAASTGGNAKVSVGTASTLDKLSVFDLIVSNWLAAENVLDVRASAWSCD